MEVFINACMRVRAKVEALYDVQIRDYPSNERTKPDTCVRTYKMAAIKIAFRTPHPHLLWIKGYHMNKYPPDLDLLSNLFDIAFSIYFPRTHSPPRRIFFSSAN